MRHELDRRIMTEILGLDDKAVDQLAILRNQWCLEPTVCGTKKTDQTRNPEEGTAENRPARGQPLRRACVNDTRECSWGFDAAVT